MEMFNIRIDVEEDGCVSLVQHNDDDPDSVILLTKDQLGIVANWLFACQKDSANGKS